MSKNTTNWQEVQSLIDRFYAGSTTQAEERLLMHVMCGDDVPEAMQADAEVFRALALEEQQSLQMPEPTPGFEQRLMACIAEAETAEQKAASQQKRKSLSLAPRWWTAAAACLLAVLLLSPHIIGHNQEQSQEFAPSDITQAEAEEYAAYALSMVSTKMKASVQELDVITHAQDQVRLALNNAFTE